MSFLRPPNWHRLKKTDNRKKWFNIKVDAKKQNAVQRKSKETGGKHGQGGLTALDERLAAIIGQSL